MTRVSKPLLLLVPVMLAAGAAAPAQAAFVTIGSDLSAPATIAQSHPRDWAAWPTAYEAGGSAVSPVQGEVALAKLKGRIVQDPSSPDKIPPVVMHIVVTRPQPDGREKLIVSTEDLPLPTSGDPQQVNLHNLQALPARICVQPGDHVALATSGGFRTQAGNFPPGAYDDGVAFQMFGRVPGSSIALFEQPAGTDDYQVGDVESGAPVPGVELLLQAVIGTAGDARFSCRTSAEQAQNIPNPGTPAPGTTTPGQVIQDGKASVVAPRSSPRVRNGAFKVGVACDAAGPCAGTLTVTNNLRKYASKGFDLQPTASAILSLKLNRAGLKQLRRGRGRLTVKAKTVTKTGTSSARFVVKKG